MSPLCGEIAMVELKRLSVSAGVGRALAMGSLLGCALGQTWLFSSKLFGV